MAEMAESECLHEVVHRVENGLKTPVPVGWYCVTCNTEFVNADQRDAEVNALWANLDEVNARLLEVIRSIEVRP
jgi:hypothetical protein